ncbi:hypothetical protein PV396_14550 [Streptomyces sp. ME02-8801-2C]|uniref:hypothetical protein n=1 Tax=Streptomyces sp. ME02-8801-2C TaxID=3028680 RepID=UPI0029B6DEF0|nr:hypothetical protein [Streptomyces sp. ME02-8801-2C]MDX3453156.1 hypothetical protein [Streptomyces sp. ME02-8801-2C]
MSKRRASAVGLALGAAFSLLGAAGTAEAAPSASPTATTVQARSNLRSGPSTQEILVGTTTKVSKAYIDCWSPGERVTVGGYTTDVWYRGVVHGGWELINVWVWGGNVNVGADPAPGIPRC